MEQANIVGLLSDTVGPMTPRFSQAMSVLCGVARIRHLAFVTSNEWSGVNIVNFAADNVGSVTPRLSLAVSVLCGVARTS